MLTKILLEQMPNWEKKLQSRCKQKSPRWKSIHVRVPLNLKIVSSTVSFTVGHTPVKYHDIFTCFSNLKAVRLLVMSSF